MIWATDVYGRSFTPPCYGECGREGVRFVGTTAGLPAIAVCAECAKLPWVFDVCTWAWERQGKGT